MLEKYQYGNIPMLEIYDPDSDGMFDTYTAYLWFAKTLTANIFFSWMDPLAFLKMQLRSHADKLEVAD